MTHANDESGPWRQPTEQEQLFENLRSLLLDVLTRQFGLSPEEADASLTEVFICYSATKDPPRDGRAWIFESVRRWAKTHLERREARQEQERREVEKLVVRPEALALLPPDDREVLRLRFAEGQSYAEMAEELGVAEHAAQRMVTEALVKLWKLQKGAGRR